MTSKEIKISSLFNNIKRAGECIDNKKLSNWDLFKSIFLSVNNRATAKRRVNQNNQKDDQTNYHDKLSQ